MLYKSVIKQKSWKLASPHLKCENLRIFSNCKLNPNKRCWSDKTNHFFKRHLGLFWWTFLSKLFYKMLKQSIYQYKGQAACSVRWKQWSVVDWNIIWNHPFVLVYNPHTSIATVQIKQQLRSMELSPSSDLNSFWFFSPKLNNTK